jgi:glycerol-3-phosphate dehydrogenase
MKRDLARLSGNVYDVVIIGGGIYGLCVAWDAILRGLSVALVERGDFGHATSSNTLRIIHGGLRYLQHGDVRRLRQSIHERTVFMRIAPHLVHPLPFLIPTYGHSMRGKEALSLALFFYDLFAFGRNCAQNPQSRLTRGRVISRQDCLRLYPGVEEKGLTGGAILYDGQMYSSERLILCFIRSAATAGADMANYVEVTGLIKESARVTGVKARDIFTGNQLDIRGSVVVNTTGPWLHNVLGLLNGRSSSCKLIFSKAFNLLVKRQLVPHYAVGIYGKSRFKDRNAVVNKGCRLFFITPWRDRSLIGTVHLPYSGDPDRLAVSEEEIETFLDDLNQVYPAAGLKRHDVCFTYSGLLPAAGHGTGELVKRYRLYDHRKEDGVDGLISVIGVKFTEARYVAEKTVDLIFKKLDKKPRKSATAETPLYGGDIEEFQRFLAAETRQQSEVLNPETIRYLIYHYGSAYKDVLKYLDRNPQSVQPYADKSRIVGAETLHAVREEMAHKLTDVIFRRTAWGIAGGAEEAWLKTCAAVMSKELGWDDSKTRREIDEAKAVFALRT